MRIGRCFLGIIIAVGLIGPAAKAQQMMGPLPAAPPGVPIINLEPRQTTGQLAVPVDKSQLLHTDQAFGELSVGNRDIADVQPLTRNLIYVLGKKRGVTNITISDQGGNVIAVVDVQVGFDVDALRRGLTELVPDERIAIRPAGDALILSGQVSSTDKLRQVLAVADRYAPNAVTNMLSVSGSQQVLLQVRFAEVQRSSLKNLNANFNLTYRNGGGRFNLDSGTGIAADAFGVISGGLTSGKYDLQASLDALEQSGALRTLAEPNLVALSGDTASFLAGGQIPVPVAQTSTVIGANAVPVVTVEFK